MNRESDRRSTAIFSEVRKEKALLYRYRLPNKNKIKIVYIVYIYPFIDVMSYLYNNLINIPGKWLII